jgi:hypothetical protein
MTRTVFQAQDLGLQSGGAFFCRLPEPRGLGRRIRCPFDRAAYWRGLRLPELAHGTRVPVTPVLGSQMLRSGGSLTSRIGSRKRFPQSRAVSTGGCNTGMEFTRWSFEVQSLTRALIEAQGYLVEVSLGVAGQVGFPGEVLSQQAIGVLVGAALPGTLRITEVDVHLRGHGEALMFGHLQPSVPGQRAPQRRGEFTNLPGQRIDYGRCVLAGYLDQDGKARVSFYQGCDVAVAGAAEQISLPVTRDGTIFNLCRPLADGDGIDDLTSGLSASSSVHGATDRSLGLQLLNQLFFSTPRAWMNKLR